MFPDSPLGSVEGESGGADSPPALLRLLASRVRELRDVRRWTRRELAVRSGLSERFLARVEAGEGNISVLRLEALALALGTTLDLLVRPRATRGSVVTLVGMRGAGKSTVGPRLAGRIGRPFIEMDRLIRESSGLPLDQLFELHGERYYRRLEYETARRILALSEPAVVAAAGGVVNEPRTWSLLRDGTTVVWLRARAEDHWARVIAQGDLRPMADNPAAMEELRGLLEEREPIYTEAALQFDTSGRSPDEVVALIAEALTERD